MRARSLCTDDEDDGAHDDKHNGDENEIRETDDDDDDHGTRTELSIGEGVGVGESVGVGVGTICWSCLLGFTQLLTACLSVACLSGLVCCHAAVVNALGSCQP